MNSRESVNKCFWSMPSVGTWLMPSAACAKSTVRGRDNGELTVGLSAEIWKAVAACLEVFEQVFLQCVGSSHVKWIQFSIELKKASPSQRIGVVTIDLRNSSKVLNIEKGGLLELWNDTAEEMKKVKKHDLIIEVNGIRGCLPEIENQDQEMRLVIKRKEVPTTTSDEFDCQLKVAALILTNEVNEHFEDPEANEYIQAKHGSIEVSPIVCITPLHYAARVGNAVMASLLLRMGADVNSCIALEPVDSDDESDGGAEELAFFHRFDAGRVTPQSLALAFGHTGIAAMLESCGGKVGEGYFFTGGVVMYKVSMPNNLCTATRESMAVMYTKDAAVKGMETYGIFDPNRSVAVQPFPNVSWHRKSDGRLRQWRSHYYDDDDYEEYHYESSDGGYD